MKHGQAAGFLGAVIVGLTGVATGDAAAGPGDFRVTLLATNVHEPVFITAVPGDSANILVLDRAGVVRRYDIASGAAASGPLLDIRSLVSTVDDGGLLGMAFDPAFGANRFLYVLYNQVGDQARVVARYTLPQGSSEVDAASGAIIWSYDRSIGHNGGWMGFSPVDGLLYLSQGDGGNASSLDAPNRAQTIVNQLHGKMLRIDPRGDDFPADPRRNYRVPPGNPFVGVAGDDEIWALGLRNPWRCSFDRANGDLWIADVGQDQREEILREAPGGPGGRNYGWRCEEGTLCTGLGGCVCGDLGLTRPFFEYDHTQGRSVTGGYVYRGGAIPALAGRYVFADFVTGRVWSLGVAGGVLGDLREHTAAFGAANSVWISTFGEDASGELYFADFIGGRVFRIVPGVPCAADFDVSGGPVQITDIFAFLTAWFGNAPSADFDGSGSVQIADIFAFLAAWFAGC